MMSRRYPETMVAAVLCAALLAWATLASGAAGAKPGLLGMESVGALVTLRSPAVTKGDHILLGEIAEIVTDDKELQGQLEKLVVGRAALPGTERTLFVGSIRVRLRQADIPESAVRLVAADDPIAIRTAASVVPGDELVAAAESAIAQWLQQKGLSVGPEHPVVACSNLGEDIRIPGWAYEVRLAGFVTPTVGTEQVSVPLAIWSEGRLQRQVTARCTVAAYGEVAVLARRLDKHARLRDVDIRWERRNLVGLPAGAIGSEWRKSPNSAEKFEGRDSYRLRRSLEAGTVLTVDLLEPLPDMCLGQEVKLVSTVGSVQVTDLGRLLKDGRIGEVVDVANVRSGRVVQGVLLAPATVWVQVGL